MQMKRMSVASLLFLVIASCASPQAIFTVVPTDTPVPTATFSPDLTSTLEPTFTPLPPSTLNDIFMASNIREVTVIARGRNSTDSLSEITDDANCRHNGKYGLHLMAMPTTDTFYKGYWFLEFGSQKPLDVSSFKSLEFWIRGKSHGENLIIRMTASPAADLSVELSDYVVIADEWKQVHIPIQAFIQNGLIDAGYLQQVTSLEWFFYPSKVLQDICVDEITFVP
jgi:hypothetical protein